MEKDEIFNETNYPGVKHSYDIAIKSYDFVLRRSDAVDRSIDSIIGWSSGINMGTIIFAAKQFELTIFDSSWFKTAIFVFAGILVCGIFARAFLGSFKIPSPDEAYEKWLRYDDWEFKRRVLDFSSRHFTRNLSLVYNKGVCMVLMSILFLINMAALAFWLTDSFLCRV